MLRINRSIPAFCILTLSAIVMGVYLAPSHREIALMQMDDFDFNVAFKNFRALHSAGDSSINVLAPLINLNIHYGDISPAIALLESYVADHPRSAEGYKKLAKLYKSSQRLNSYCDALEKLQNLSPSTDTLRELASTYAFLGRNKDEMSALARLVESKDYRPIEEDYVRLASLLRMGQQQDEAIRVIRDYVEDAHYRVGIDTIDLAIQMFQEAGEERKALAFAKAYLRKQVNEDDAVLISTLFEARGQFDSAYDILTPFLDNMYKSTNLEQQVVDLMLEQKKDDEVFAMLSTQRAKDGTLAPPLAVALTDLAVTRADYALLESLIRSQNLEDLPEETLLHYADMSFRLKRTDLAQFMQSKLSGDYLRQSPALGAVLAVAADDTPKNMDALVALPHDAVLSTEAKIVLADIYLQHALSQNAFALLDNMPVANILNAFDTEQYAQLYLDEGAAAKAERALNDARPTSPTEIQDSIDQALLLLAAGQGEAEFVRQKLAAYSGSDSDLWPSAYDLAIRYHHDELGLTIAKQLYQIAPTVSNRTQLVEALMINHHFADALDLLHGLTEKDADARAMYLDVISTWAQQPGGIQALPDSQKAIFNAAIESALKNPNLSVEDKQDVAAVLEEAGLYAQSESILVKLAGNQPYNTPDVIDLLGFWEDHPSPLSVSWVEKRARHSSGAEEVAWLTYLNDNGHPQTVIDILRGREDMSSAVADQYIEALVESHNKEMLEFTLEENIANETNPVRIRKLATIADDEDVGTASEKAWRKLYTINPGDNEAAKQLGLMSYDADRYEEAEPLLKQYLQYSQEDYRANLAYGEILQQGDRKDEADPYFRRALQQISGIKDKDPATQLDEAYLLYYTDNLTESLSLFRQLLAQNPGDEEVRADFGEVLTEIGRVDEAAAVLSH